MKQLFVLLGIVALSVIFVQTADAATAIQKDLTPEEQAVLDNIDPIERAEAIANYYAEGEPFAANIDWSEVPSSQCIGYEYPNESHTKYVRICSQEVILENEIDEEPIPEESDTEMGEMSEIDTEDVIPDLYDGLDEWQGVIDRLEDDRAKLRPSVLMQLEKAESIVFYGGVCLQGIDWTTTATTQNERAFPIPMVEVPVFDDNRNPTGETRVVMDVTGFTNEQLEGKLKKVFLAVEECIAQQKLLDPHDGTGFSLVDTHKGICQEQAPTMTKSKSIQLGCAFNTEQHLAEIAKTMEPWSQDRVNFEANKDIVKVTREANDLHCDPRKYTQTLRDAYGCPPVTIEYISTLPTPPVKDYIDNPVWKSYVQCRDGNCIQQFEKVAYPVIQERIAELERMKAELEAQLEAQK